MQSIPVVILNEGGAEVLVEGVLRGIEHAVIDARDLPFPTWREIRDILVDLAPRHLFESIELRGWRRLRYLVGRIKRLRLLWRMQQLNPDVVLTFVDNDYDFQWLSRRCAAKFIAVQNGVRAPYDMSKWLPDFPHPAAHISMPELVCFGAYEQDLYSRFGHAIDRYHRLGSIRAALYAAQRPVRREWAYELCVISQRFEGFEAPPELIRELPETLEALYSATARYVGERRLKACIALRSGSDDEEAYFRRLFGDGVEVIRNDRRTYSTYAAVDRSNVAIALDSTVAWEMFGLGCKVLFCNFGPDANYNFPVGGVWALSQPAGFAEFAERLDMLRAMAADEYLESSREAREYVMHVDSECSAHAALRAIIESQLRKPRGAHA